MIVASVAVGLISLLVVGTASVSASAPAVTSVKLAHYEGSVKKGIMQMEESLSYPKTTTKTMTIATKDTIRVEFTMPVNAYHQMSLLLVPSASNKDDDLAAHPLAESIPSSKSLLIPYVKSVEAYRLDVTSKKLNVDRHDKESWPLAGGNYDIQLFLAPLEGDAVTWTLASEVQFEYPTLEEITSVYTDDPEADVFWAKEDMKHVFPPEEVHVGKTFGTLYAAIVVVVPWTFLIVAWGAFGFNISKFPWTSVSLLPTAVFVGSLAAIMSLFALAWIQLQFFTTLQYLAVIGIVASLSGKSALSAVAKQRMD